MPGYRTLAQASYSPVLGADAAFTYPCSRCRR
jgi:hypothetical protein